MWDWMGALHMATGYTMQHTHSIMRWLIREPAHLRRVTGVRRDQRERIAIMPNVQVTTRGCQQTLYRLRAAKRN